MPNHQTSSGPGIWPRQQPRQTESQAENKVYQAISKFLPKGMWAWHSMRLRSPKSGEHAEADFILADPARPGAVILEVKGGQICQQDGAWYQYDKLLNPPPLDQAHRCRRILMDCLESKGVKAPFIAVAACFPDCSFDKQPSQGNLNGIVLSQEHLVHLEEILPTLVERAIPQPWPADSKWVYELHQLWGETWIPCMRLGRQVELEKEQRLRLDEEQAARLCELEDNRRMLITGGAGTGKTVLAREAALRMAAQGKRVLVLCYTDALASGLAMDMVHPNLKAAPIRRLAVELLKAGGLDSLDESDPDFWKGISLRAVDLMPADDKWDAVVVDEGQDFSDNDWFLVEECLADKGCLWIFADQRQGFWANRQIPSEIMDQAFKVKLRRPYRCPEPIQHLVDCYAGRCQADAKALNQGIKSGQIKIITSSEAKLAKQVGKEVNRLISEGLKPHDIAVLSLRGRGASDSIIHNEQLGTQRVVSATDPAASSHVVNDTFLRFKGLERPAVIVTDLRLVSDDYNTRMHIAVSRAANLLRVIGGQAAINDDSIMKQML